jgi:RecG-like helicase
MTEPTEKPCTNLEFLARMAGKQSKFWGDIRKRLEKGEDICILCPTLEKAKLMTKEIRHMIEYLKHNGVISKSKVKVTHPFEKVSGRGIWTNQ